MRRIIIVGGLGLFGRAAADLLRSRGIVPLTASRRPGADLQIDADNPASIKAALHSGDLIIDAAGPFQSRSTALVEAAIGSRFDIIDPGSAFDIAAGKVILQSDSASKSAAIAQLAAAVTAGANGGITSSTAAANPDHLAVGLFDNALHNLTSFASQLVNENSLFLAVATPGDTNFDAIVDINDLGNLANHWQQSATTWSRGDFNMDGFVDIEDLGILAGHWQQTTEPGFGINTQYQIPDTQPTSIPEPATALLLAGTLPLLRRRRRSMLIKS